MTLSSTDAGIGLIYPVAFAVFAWYIGSCFISWYRLREFPGPFWASVSYLWIGRLAWGGEHYKVHRELGRQYGHLVRTGPNELVTDDPEVMRRMSAARSPYHKDTWYLGARLNAYHDNMFLILDAHAHDKAKAKIFGAYSGREFPELERGIDFQVNHLMDIIRSRYVQSVDKAGLSRSLDLAPLMSYFTLDVITQAAFGKAFGYLDTESDLYEWFETLRAFFPFASLSVNVPWIRNFFYSPIVLKFFGPKTTDKKGIGRLMWVAQNEVNKRFDSGAKEENDMLGSFIKHGLSREDCESEGLFMVVAGSETTASALRVIMLYVMTTPRVYQKLKRIIADAVRDRTVSSPITYEQAKKIPYLQAVLTEGLRMRPPAPSLFPKSVPKGGDTIHGKFVPEGTAIGMNTPSLMRSYEEFGPDPDVFRPERFMEADGTQRAKMERTVDLLFGYGRWICAGKPVALMELNKVCFELLRAFDFQLENPLKPWDTEAYTIFMEYNFWVKVTDAKLMEHATGT
ncbi:hypothetical protein N7468_003017, partial [Penicillium chermesinum]